MCLPSFSLLRDLQNLKLLEIDFHPSNSTGSFTLGFTLSVDGNPFSARFVLEGCVAVKVTVNMVP